MKLLISFLILTLLNLYNFFILLKENFKLPVYKAHNVYINYRNYIDNNYSSNYNSNYSDNYLDNNNISQLDNYYSNHYKISDNCFSDKYEKCNDLFNSKQNSYCQDLSLNLCKFKSPI